MMFKALNEPKETPNETNIQTNKDVLSLNGIRIDESGEESDMSNEITLESSTDDDFEEKLKSFEEYEESFSENSDRNFKSYVVW